MDQGAEDTSGREIISVTLQAGLLDMHPTFSQNSYPLKKRLIRPSSNYAMASKELLLSSLLLHYTHPKGELLNHYSRTRDGNKEDDH